MTIKKGGTDALKTALMLQGTSSGAGKSLMTAAFCRHFKNLGLSVSPFKSQNMALNAYVTTDGKELAFAQAFQAYAAGIPPSCDMNPLLLKPKGNNTSQVIMNGKPVGDMRAGEYHLRFKETAVGAIDDSIRVLREKFDVLIAEGAGSPVEMNLKKNDLCNMHVAKSLGAPVIIVTDIDRGGSIASLHGTYDLLEPEEKDMVKGFIINKFRGDLSLFEPAKQIILELTGKPVIGVVPMLAGIDLPEEDSQFGLDNAGSAGNVQNGEEAGVRLRIRTVKLPHISNFSDLDPFKAGILYEHRFVEKAEDLQDADIIILPGTKNAVEDLLWCKKNGIADMVCGLAAEGAIVIGICGGLQMLGAVLEDPNGFESNKTRLDGMSLLPVATTFMEHKKSNAEEYIVNGSAPLGLKTGTVVRGYEIRHGRTVVLDACADGVNFLERAPLGRSNLVQDIDRQARLDQAGFRNAQGNVIGTYLHGFFDNPAVLEALTRKALDRRLGMHFAGTDQKTFNRGDLFHGFEKYDEALDELERTLTEHVDMPFIYRIMGF